MIYLPFVFYTAGLVSGVCLLLAAQRWRAARPPSWAKGMPVEEFRAFGATIPMPPCKPPANPVDRIAAAREDPEVFRREVLGEPHLGWNPAPPADPDAIRFGPEEGGFFNPKVVCGQVPASTVRDFGHMHLACGLSGADSYEPGSGWTAWCSCGMQFSGPLAGAALCKRDAHAASALRSATLVAKVDALKAEQDAVIRQTIHRQCLWDFSPKLHVDIGPERNPRIFAWQARCSCGWVGLPFSLTEAMLAIEDHCLEANEHDALSWSGLEVQAGALPDGRLWWGSREGFERERAACHRYVRVSSDGASFGGPTPDGPWTPAPWGTSYMGPAPAPASP